jgi:hypothetical protein
VRVSYAAERAAGTPPPDSCHAAGVADSSGSSRASPLPQSSEFPRAALCFHSASRHRLSSATKARSPEGHIHSEGRSEPCSRTRSRNLSARSLALQQAMGSPRSVQRHKRPAPIEPGDRGSRRNEDIGDRCGSAAEREGGLPLPGSICKVSSVSRPVREQGSLPQSGLAPTVSSRSHSHFHAVPEVVRHKPITVYCYSTHPQRHRPA